MKSVSVYKEEKRAWNLMSVETQVNWATDNIFLYAATTYDPMGQPSRNIAGVKVNFMCQVLHQRCLTDLDQRCYKDMGQRVGIMRLLGCRLSLFGRERVELINCEELVSSGE